MRNLSAQPNSYASRTGSPFATPMGSAKRAPPFSLAAEQDPRSDGPEMPSSVLAAPPTEGRMLGAYSAGSSPLMVAKQRAVNGNGIARTPLQAQQQPTEGVPGWRQISGASTIDAPLSAEKVISPEQPRHNGQHMHPRYDANGHGTPRQQVEHYAPASGAIGVLPLSHRLFEEPSPSASGLGVQRYQAYAEPGLSRDGLATMPGSSSFRPTDGAGAFATHAPAPMSGMSGLNDQV
jgi:hypothetical protein